MTQLRDVDQNHRYADRLSLRVEHRYAAGKQELFTALLEELDRSRVFLGLKRLARGGHLRENGAEPAQAQLGDAGAGGNLEMQLGRGVGNFNFPVRADYHDRIVQAVDG